MLANVGNQTGANQLPITSTGNSPFKNPDVTSGGLNTKDVLRSASVAAGVIGTATPPFGFLVGTLLASGLKLEVALNALEERGMVRRLAEPNLVALSGDTASFLAGGEYPIPMIGSFGQPSVEFKRYGVSLAFTPTVLSGTIINLKIEPEVSQIDPSVSVTLSGISVPGLTVRRASTTLELRDGQSFVLAGLLQNETKTQQQQLPWIGDVPVIGALFSSKAYLKNESDLVIIVTPHLARPARPGDPIRTPFDNTIPGNDLDFFAGGKAELDRGPAVRGETAALRPYTGHMIEFPVGGGDVVR
jgi:pilus assembly protein CpaC